MLEFVSPPLAFFNPMACSGVERIKTAADDDSVQFWKAHKHMHECITQDHTAATWILTLEQHRQSAGIFTCMHIQRHHHMHELAHMHAHTVSLPTLIHAKTHVTHVSIVSLCPCSFSPSLTHCCQSLDSSSVLPCPIVPCDLSCEISDTEWRLSLLMPDLTPGTADGRETAGRKELPREKVKMQRIWLLERET